jgi:hypothetical protein
MQGTISSIIRFDEVAIEGVSYPPVNVVLRVKINANITGAFDTLPTGKVSLPPIVMTTGKASNYLLAVSDAESNQSNLDVQSAARFAVSQQIDVYENGSPANRETAEVMGVTGNRLVVRPRLTKTHPKGAMVVAIGGMRAMVYGPNDRIATLRSPLPIKGAAIGLVFPFQPNIEKQINIQITATGAVVVPPITGYFFTPPIRVTATARALTYRSIEGNATTNVVIKGAIRGFSDPVEARDGFVDQPVIVSSSISAIAISASPRIATIKASVKVSAQALIVQEVVGRIKTPVVVASAIVGDHTVKPSIYGEVKFTSKLRGVSGMQVGTIALSLPIASIIKAQSLDPNNAFYGAISYDDDGKPAPARIIVSPLNLRARLTPVGRTAVPIPFKIIAGYQQQTTDTNGVVNTVTVARPIAAQSYTETGLPTPKDFFYGSIGVETPKATVTLTIAGTTGDLQLFARRTPIMFPVSDPTPANVAAAINSYGERYYSAFVQGSTLLLFALASGAQENGREVTHTTSGDRTLNGQAAGTTAAIFAGGSAGNVQIQATATASQYEGQVVGNLASPIDIRVSATGSLLGNTGFLNAAFAIKGSLVDAIYGVSIAKLNTHAIVGTPTAVTVAKATVQAMTITPPSNQTIAKAVAYAVIGAEGDFGESAYEAIFFF